MPRPLLTLCAAAVVAACSDRPLSTAPDALVRTTPSGTFDAIKAWESNAAIYWNAQARGLVAAKGTGAPAAIRGYAVVAVAQYQAAIAAAKGSDRGDQPSVHAAISAASVVALSYLYPDQTSNLETRLDQYLTSASWPGNQHPDPAAGEAIGRVVAAQVVARAQTDGFFAPWTGTVPTGPGKWFSATPPAGARFGEAKTYFLLSGNQFRPPPPPAFGSPEFNAALAEVRQISDTRTPQQIAIAQFWNLPVGTYQPPGYWNEEATALAVKYRLNEIQTAHTLALMNMVAFDGIVASHEAKFFYWLLRPTMADPAITLPIGLPNFPSYPSNHATISAGMARILGDRFPAEKVRLDALADEAALSRVYGGIHYRFDGEAGLALGRTIAAWALAHDVRGKRPFELR